MVLGVLVTSCQSERKDAAATASAGSSTTAAAPAAASTGTPPATAAPAAITFVPSLGVDLMAMTKTPSGLLYRDIRVGTGATATAGHSVSVQYTGWLPDGTKFDSSRDRNEPFDFSLGAGQVIHGWDEGVAGMRIGGRRQLVIPPDLAYGSAGTGPIPPNATLVFDVELLRVQ